MNIPILKLPFTDADMQAIADNSLEVMKSGNLVMGKYTDQFEAEFAKFCGTKYALTVNSGTSAIELVLRGLGVEGGTVIVPTNTFVATAFAAMHCGSKIKFVDCDKESFCIDPDDLKSKIDGDVKAVIIVHIGGVITPHFDEIKKICDDAGIPLVEDCAHAHGCSLNGKMAGSLGAGGAFSFFPTKVLVTGEGGMITTNSDEMYEKIRIIRNHGKDFNNKNAITAVGHNWRMSEVQSVMGVEQMKQVDNIIGSRQETAAYYDDAFKSVDGFTPLALADGAVSSYYKYLVMLDEKIDRAEFKKRLKEEHNITMTGEVYSSLVHEEPYFQKNGYGDIDTPSDFPNSYYVSRNHVCPPCYTGLSKEEREYVVDCTKKVISSL